MSTTPADAFPQPVFREINLTIPDSAWTPCGPDEDEQAQLTVKLVINGSAMYLEAYAIHDECDDEDHMAAGHHGSLGDLTAFDRLAVAHGVGSRVQTIIINNRLYAMFAEPTGA